MDLKEYSKYIDHSPLKMDASESEIITFCNEALKYSFHSMVVFPHYIDLAKSILEDSDVKVDTVVGFPFGNELISVKSHQARTYLKMGATEIFLAMIEAGASRVGTSKGIELLGGLQNSSRQYIIKYE